MRKLGEKGRVGSRLMLRRLQDDLPKEEKFEEKKEVKQAVVAAAA